MESLWVDLCNRAGVITSPAWPVHVIKNNRPSYVVMSEDDDARLIERKGLWELLDQPTRGIRSKEDIDAQACAERGSWGDS